MTNMTNMTNQTKTFNKGVLLHREKSKSALLVESSLTPVVSGGEFPEGTEVVFRWGCTASVPDGVSVVNSVKAIHRVFDKGNFRRAMYEAGLTMPTYLDFGELLDEESSGPWIVRPSEHQRSEDLHLCKTLREVYETIKLPKLSKGYYISDFIQKNEEYRVICCQGRVVAVVRKIPKDKSAVSWGCVTQGSFEYVPWSEWPLEVVQKALGAMELSRLTFGAVDVIRASTGLAYVLEVNTAMYLTPYYGKALGKAFEYILKNGKDDIETKTNPTWKDLIHPAIYEGAL